MLRRAQTHVPLSTAHAVSRGDGRRRRRVLVWHHIALTRRPAGACDFSFLSFFSDFGFDPLNLGKNEVALKWYQQAELQNGRWAMLGVAGILVQVRGPAVVVLCRAVLCWTDAAHGWCPGAGAVQR